MEAGSATEAGATPQELTPFERFQDEVARGGSQGELTYDLDNIGRLSAEERAAADKLLEQRALEQGDTRAIETLAALGVTEAIPLFEKLEADPRPAVRVTATRALALLRPSPAVAARLGAELGQGLAPLDAAEAAWSLRQLAGPEAIAGLLVALRASSVTARMHAWEGLIEKLALPATLNKPHQTPLRTLYTRTITGLDSVWPAGAAAAAEALQALAGGSTAEALGLVYAPGDPALIRRLWASLEEASPAIDVAAIEAMEGHDRQWAEHKLVYELGARDPRAADAIGAIGLRAAVPALEEARRRWGWSEPLVAAIDRSLARLRPPAGPSAPDPAALPELTDRLLSGDRAAREGAWATIVTRLDLPPASGPRSWGPAAALALRLATPLRAVWEPAAYQARRQLKQAERGEAPFTYVPGDAALREEALATLSATTGDAIQQAPLRAMTGHDREWVEAHLLSRVGERDVRAIDAAAALRLKGLEGVLLEARKAWSDPSPELAVTLQTALLFLKG
jgi:hypothetical protein